MYSFTQHLDDMEHLSGSKPKEFCKRCGNEITENNKKVGHGCSTCTEIL